MRILIRTSKWAVWARRLGSFALPVLIIPVFLHRTRAINSETFILTLGVASLVAALAVLFAVVAMIRLWHSGDRGWSRAITGFFLGFVCLLPTGFGLVQAVRFPLTNEISSDWTDPPPFILSHDEVPGRASDAELTAAFPNVVNRNYQLPASVIFGLVEGLMVERGWEIRVRRQPDDLGRMGQLNAIETTLFGWRDEIALIVEETGDGTRVIMASHSLFGYHDLGVNGTRVGNFLRQLDVSVSEYVRDNPVLAPEPEEEAPPPVGLAEEVAPSPQSP